MSNNNLNKTGINIINRYKQAYKFMDDGPTEEPMKKYNGQFPDIPAEFPGSIMGESHQLADEETELNLRMKI